jgi:hypothetical protein
MQMFQIWGVFMVLGGVCGALMAWGVDLAILTLSEWRCGIKSTEK